MGRRQPRILLCETFSPYGTTTIPNKNVKLNAKRPHRSFRRSKRAKPTRPNLSATVGSQTSDAVGPENLLRPNLNPLVVFHGDEVFHGYLVICHSYLISSHISLKNLLEHPIISKRQIQRMRSHRPSFQAYGTPEAFAIDGIDGFVRGQRCQNNNTLLSKWGEVDVRINNLRPFRFKQNQNVIDDM